MLQDTVYDATIGLLKQYQEKTLDLAKIMTLKFYVQGLKLFRKHLVLVFFLIFTVILLAVSIVVIPVAMVMLTSWASQTKILCIGLLGLFYIGITAGLMSLLFSEEKWMQVSGIKELLDEFDTKSNS